MKRFVIGILLTANDLAIAATVQTSVGPRATGYLGWPTQEARLKAPYKGIEVNESWMPKSFSWRNSGIVPETKNQGNCGSCFSFAITRSMEIAVVLQGFRDMPNLAEQQIVSCAKDAYGCGGGFMTTAQYVVDVGLTDEKNFPYQAANLACKKSLPIKEKAISYSLLGSATKSPSVQEIKAAILRYGSAFVTVSAGGSGWSGSSDRVTGCKNRGTNHMVVLVGYDEKNWIMSNSWGKEWGDGGYAKVPFGCDQIGDEAGYIEVE